MRRLSLIGLIGGNLLGAICFAAAPAGAPAGATGLCKDGTYYSGTSARGACRGHQGLKEWFGGPASGAPASPTAAATTAKPAAGAAAPAPRTVARVPVTAGAAGKVWANKSTKVYHCPGDRWYGKTKTGEYMSEAQARSQGFRPEHGKACQ
jgi:lipoprotein-anchoring transpeptidase ErfK/SrfK